MTSPSHIHPHPPTFSLPYWQWYFKHLMCVFSIYLSVARPNGLISGYRTVPIHPILILVKSPLLERLSDQSCRDLEVSLGIAV